MKTRCIQTDQRYCYGDDGGRLPCVGTGQDGDTRTGIIWPEPRFAKQEGAVRDHLTGLIWTRNAAPVEFPLAWNDAHAAVREMNRSRAFGSGEWRLPERRELFSLVSHSRCNPALPDGHPFVDVFDGYYWTGTPCARWPKQAWYVHMGGGRVFKGMKHGAYMVWPVRDGAPGKARLPLSGAPDGESANPPSDERFASAHMGVTDTRTSLMWFQNADFSRGPVTWREALSAVAEWNEDPNRPYNDWRLPNIRELESLTDMSVHSPAIRGRKLFENIQEFYWSSTTSVYDPTYAWTLYAEDGNIGVGFKKTPEFHVWPVRNHRR